MITTNTSAAPSETAPLPTGLRLLSGAAIATTLPYAALKVAWLCGSRIGLQDSEFGTSATMHVANGLTLALDAVAALLAFTFAARRGRRAPGVLVAFPMWVGAGLLGEILLLMPLTLVGGTVGSRPSSGAGPIADWVYAVVYAGFTGLGLFLLPAFAWYAWIRWGDQLRVGVSARGPVARPGVWAGAMSSTGLGIAGVAAARAVSADAARWMIVDTILAGAAAVGLVVLARGLSRVRRVWPVAAAFVGSGALFAWGAFQTTLALVPNDLVGDGPVPTWVTAYALARLAAGAVGGIALATAVLPARRRRRS